MIWETIQHMMMKRSNRRWLFCRCSSPTGGTTLSRDEPQQIPLIEWYQQGKTFNIYNSSCVAGDVWRIELNLCYDDDNFLCGNCYAILAPSSHTAIYVVKTTLWSQIFQLARVFTAKYITITVICATIIMFALIHNLDHGVVLQENWLRAKEWWNL